MCTAPLSTVAGHHGSFGAEHVTTFLHCACLRSPKISGILAVFGCCFSLDADGHLVFVGLLILYYFEITCLH